MDNYFLQLMKFGVKLHRWLNYASKIKYSMAADAMLNSFAFKYAVIGAHSLPSKYHILLQYLVPHWVVGTWWDSDGGHVRFSKTWFLSNGSPWAFPSLYQIWRNNVERRRNYGSKSKSKMAAVRRLEFSKTWFLSTGPLGLPIFHLGTKFGSKILIDAESMGQNRNPKWRPSAILDFR